MLKCIVFSDSKSVFDLIAQLQQSSIIDITKDNSRGVQRILTPVDELKKQFIFAENEDLHIQTYLISDIVKFSDDQLEQIKLRFLTKSGHPVKAKDIKRATIQQDHQFLDELIHNKPLAAALCSANVYQGKYSFLNVTAPNCSFYHIPVTFLPATTDEEDNAEYAALSLYYSQKLALLEKKVILNAALYSLINVNFWQKQLYKRHQIKKYFLIASAAIKEKIEMEVNILNQEMRDNLIFLAKQKKLLIQLRDDLLVSLKSRGPLPDIHSQYQRYADTVYRYIQKYHLPEYTLKSIDFITPHLRTLKLVATTILCRGAIEAMRRASLQNAQQFFLLIESAMKPVLIGLSVNLLLGIIDKYQKNIRSTLNYISNYKGLKRHAADYQKLRSYEESLNVLDKQVHDINQFEKNISKLGNNVAFDSPIRLFGGTRKPRQQQIERNERMTLSCF